MVVDAGSIGGSILITKSKRSRGGRCGHRNGGNVNTNAYEQPHMLEGALQESGATVVEEADQSKN